MWDCWLDIISTKSAITFGCTTLKELVNFDESTIRSSLIAKRSVHDLI